MSRDRALRWAWSAGACATLLALTGCQAVGLRSEDGDGSPLRVAVQPTRGSAASGEATDDDALPAGWHTVPAAFTCPVQMRIALPPGWSPKGSQPGDLFIAAGKDTQLSGPRVSAFCSAASGQSPAEVVESAAKYRYDRRTSTLTSQRSYEFAAGSAWVFDIDFAAKNSNAAGHPTSARGFVAGVRANGKVYQVTLLSNAPADDEQGIAQAEDIAAHVTIGNTRLQRPQPSRPQPSDGSADD